MHVLTNGCWRTVSFWLICPKQNGAPVSRASTRTTQACGGEYCQDPPKVHQSPIRPCWVSEHERMGKDLTPHHCSGSGCRRVRDRPTLDKLQALSSGAGTANPRRARNSGPSTFIKDVGPQSDVSRAFCTGNVLSSGIRIVTVFSRRVQQLSGPTPAYCHTVLCTCICGCQQHRMR